MSLEQNVMAELKAAMLARDEGALRGLRAVKSAILLAKTSGAGADLKPEDEVKLLQKLVKQRKESADIYNQQGRPDLAKSELEEIAVIEKFLPSMMSEDEIRAVVRNVIESTGAASAADLGKVMGVVTKQLAGKADNKTVAALVKEMLS